MSMFAQNSGPSLSDIAALMNGNNNMNNDWWVWILLLACWGPDGLGNGNGRSSSTNDIESAVQRGFDTQTIVNKLDGLNSGICSLGYDQLAQMNNIQASVAQNANTIQGAINQLGISNMQDTFGIQQAINADTVANMQNMNTLIRTIDNCCCENKSALADIKYSMATDTCAINNNIHMTGDAIINSQTNGFNMLAQTIKDGFAQAEYREMARENADLRQRLNDCSRDGALRNMANYIVNEVRPTPIPSWDVPNPWQQTNNRCNNGF